MGEGGRDISEEKERGEETQGKENTLRESEGRRERKTGRTAGARGKEEGRKEEETDHEGKTGGEVEIHGEGGGESEGNSQGGKRRRREEGRRKRGGAGQWRLSRPTLLPVPWEPPSPAWNHEWEHTGEWGRGGTQGLEVLPVLPVWEWPGTERM